MLFFKIHGNLIYGGITCREIFVSFNIFLMPFSHLVVFLNNAQSYYFEYCKIIISTIIIPQLHSHRLLSIYNIQQSDLLLQLQNFDNGFFMMPKTTCKQSNRYSLLHQSFLDIYYHCRKQSYVYSVTQGILYSNLYNLFTSLERDFTSQ